jgi:hypothetical protein
MKFTLEIEMNNDAMSEATDLAASLRDVARKLALESRVDDVVYLGSMTIRDINGNSVGSWKLSNEQKHVPERQDALQTIDLTPRGLLTSEGARRVSESMALLNEATAAVANLACRFVSLESLVSNELSEELGELREAVELRNDRQESFLRAVAGVPAR